MNKYCITAARPKDVEHQLNTEFKLWEWRLREREWKWVLHGWKRISAVAALLEAGNEVLTARQVPNGIRTGEAVELELRIAHNGKNYKLSEMPDE